MDIGCDAVAEALRRKQFLNHNSLSRIPTTEIPVRLWPVDREALTYVIADMEYPFLGLVLLVFANDATTRIERFKRVGSTADSCSNFFEAVECFRLQVAVR